MKVDFSILEKLIHTLKNFGRASKSRSDLQSKRTFSVSVVVNHRHSTSPRSGSISQRNVMLRPYRSPRIDRARLVRGSRVRYRHAARRRKVLPRQRCGCAPRRVPGIYCARCTGYFLGVASSLGRGMDDARGSLVLMSNESMIRGGGPEAWRHLDLADGAKSKPVPPSSARPRRAPFAHLRLVLFASHIPLVLRLSLLPARGSPRAASRGG